MNRTYPWTYYDLQTAFQHKSKGRKYKALDAMTHLYPREDGAWELHAGYKKKELCATLERDGTWTLFNGRHGWGAFVIWLRPRTGFVAYSRQDHTCSVSKWIKTNAGEEPYFDGIRIRGGVVLNQKVVVQRRRVQRSVSGPVHAQIRAWDRLAKTFFGVGNPQTIADLLAARPPAIADLPTLGDEPTVAGIIAMLPHDMPWWVNFNGYSGKAEELKSERVRRWAKGAFNTAFKKWKEELYTEHGAYNWVNIDKAA